MADVYCTFAGLGSAVQLAQTNTYCALKRNAAQSLGLLHGGYVSDEATKHPRKV